MCILDILQFESTSFFLCVPILGLILTYCFLGVIKALYNKSNIICCVVKVHQWCKPWLRLIVIEWKSIHYFACGLEIPLSITEPNLAYTGIMEGMRQKFRSLRFWEGNIRSSLWQKRLDFCLEINKFWVRVWSLPKEKYELLKIWTNIKFTKFSEKSKFCSDKWSKPKSEINPSHVGFERGLIWIRTRAKSGKISKNI